ncbi:hypothetical protein [Pseudomonas putida]|uniref:Uncharacterized protein n=1 Tax=Pseudomonas putida TaxID=303 RepID=A0A8I1EBX7_PSEPU|nr:hypothetical protein [Pseudomonas putida]MBI6882463.1 hypothetical protein [Pseudomonas putida]
MTKDQFEKDLVRVAEVQRKAGWSQNSIDLYAAEIRAINGDNLNGLLAVGAGLACDNTRFGVPNRKP